jgi:hypothetical protein
MSLNNKELERWMNRLNIKKMTYGGLANQKTVAQTYE